MRNERSATAAAGLAVLTILAAGMPAHTARADTSDGPWERHTTYRNTCCACGFGRDFPAAPAGARKSVTDRKSRHRARQEPS
jgi:hypothetical protein